MKNNIFKLSTLILCSALLLIGCSDTKNNDTEVPTEKPDETKDIDFSGTYTQKDQMGRPAVNTVFVNDASKDKFNVTIPSEQNAAFQAIFETNLKKLSPAYKNDGDKNALGQDAKAFTELLATDVLNVDLEKKTTIYDGTNVLTGRALADDVITVELLLIFGGEDFKENSGLSDDNVSKNDKEFLTSFPYLASPW